MTYGLRRHAALGGLGMTSLVAMGLAFVTNILITRALTDAAFGEYRLAVNSAIAMFGFLNLGLQVTTARKLAAEDDTGLQREILGDGIALLVAVCLGGAGVVAGGALLLSFGSERGLVAAFAATLLLPVGLQRGLVYLLRGSQRFAHIGFQTVAPPLIVALVWVFAPILGVQELALDSSFAVAVYGSSFALVHFISVGFLRPSIRRGAVARWRRYLTDNTGEGWQVYKGSLVGVVSADIVSVVVGFTSDLGQYGTYALAWSLASPLTQLPVVLQTLHFRGFARDGQIRSRTLGLLAGASAASLLSGLALVNALKPRLYGDGYEDLLPLLSILGVALLIHGIGDYVNSYHIARGRSDRARRAAYATGLGMVASALIVVPLLGVWGLAISRLTASLVYLLMGMSRLELKR